MTRAQAYDGTIESGRLGHVYFGYASVPRIDGYDLESNWTRRAI